MRIDFTINGSSDASARYLTWTRSPLRLRLLDAPPAPASVAISLSSLSAPQGGTLRFAASDTGPLRATLNVALPSNGQSVTVWVCGQFGKPSTADRDVSIVAATAQGQILAELPVMVRVRKDANTLTAAERDRFLAAFGQLNDRGVGRFIDFRNMHTARSVRQAHGDAAFLPWHRAYLLDLERELQAIDPSVCLPYWRFDRPAPKVFTRDFMGNADSDGWVDFSPGNPLAFWATSGRVGVYRELGSTDPSVKKAPWVESESQTMARGTAFRTFRRLESDMTDAHGRAHTSYFGGDISVLNTAAQDPLFFLLHCNVDRLWARWQQLNGRYDASLAAAYDNGPTPTSRPAGHNLGDSLWPWNNIGAPDRPADPPGGDMARSPCVAAPGSAPLVRDMLDFQGRVQRSANLGFAYDSVS